MADIEHSVAAYDREIERHTENVKELSACILKSKLKICNSEKQILMEKLGKRDQTLYAVQQQLQEFLKILNDNQTELNEMPASSERKRQPLEIEDTNERFDSSVSNEVLRNKSHKTDGKNQRLQKRVIKDEENQTTYLENQNFQEKYNKLKILIQRNMQDLQKTIRPCYHNGNGLEELFYSTQIKVEDRTEFQEKDMTTKDENLFQFNCNLHHTEHLESEIKRHEKSSMEEDKLLSNMKDQVQQTLKKLHQTAAECDEVIKSLETRNWCLETELDEIKASLQKKTQSLERDIENRDINIKHLENQIDNINGRKEELLKNLDRKDKQLSEQRNRYQNCLGQLHTKYEILEGSTVLLKTRIQHLEKEKENSDLKIKFLEEIIENDKTDSRDTSEQLYHRIQEVKERDDQLSEMSDQPEIILNQINRTESELMANKEENQGLNVKIEDRDLKLNELQNKELEWCSLTVHSLEKEVKRQTKQRKDMDKRLVEIEIECNDEISDRESKMRNIETNHYDNTKDFESDVERREQDVGDLNKMLSKSKLELNQFSDRNKFLQKKTNEKETQIRELTDQIKYFQQKEAESKSIITALQKQNQSLVKDIECYHVRVKDLEENMKTEICRVKEHLVQKVKEKDQQLSEQKNQLKQALKKSLYEKEVELDGIITSLRKQNQKLDSQLSELRDDLNQTLKTLTDKEDKIKELDAALKFNSDLLKAEVGRREQTIRQLNETLSTKHFEISQLSKRNGILEYERQVKDDQLRGQEDPTRQNLKEKKETEYKLDRIVTFLKEKTEYLQTELHHRDRRVKDLEKMLHERKVENISNNEREIDVYQKEQMITEPKCKLQQTLTKLQDTETDLDEMKTRLGKAMGDRRTDNTNITDLSDKNRPTKLAERFAELYDNQWTDAFDILDKYFDTEENIIKVLLLILHDAMTFCKTKAHEQMKELRCLMELSSKHGKGEEASSGRNLLKDCRKAMASDAVENVHEMYLSYLKQSTDETSRLALEVSSYSKECLEICWLMVVQDPPVVFAPLVKKGSNFNTDLYKPFECSGTHVDYVVWPPVLLHEGGSVLVKGVARGYSKA